MRASPSSLALIALLWAGGQWSARAAPGGADQRFAYIVEPDGQVIKLDLPGGRVVYRSMLGGPTLEVGPDERPGIESAALEESAPALIIVRADSFAAEDQPTVPYRVLRLSLPALEPTADFVIPRDQERPPMLLMDSYRARVLVHWEEAPLLSNSGSLIEWRYRVSALSLPGLSELHRWSGVRDTDASGVKPFPWFYHYGAWISLTPEAVIGPDSTRVLNPRGTLTFTADSFTGRFDRLDVSPELDASLRRGLRLAPHQGRTSFGYPMPVDARGGRILWKSWSDSTNPRFDVLLTSGDSASSPEAVWSVPWSSAWLLPAGRTVVVQEIEGPHGAGTTELRKTGRLTFYDAPTGQQRFAASIPEIAGAYESVRFLCASADEEYLLFRSAEGQVYSIQAGAKRASLRPIRPVTTVSPSAGCFPSRR